MTHLLYGISFAGWQYVRYAPVLVLPALIIGWMAYRSIKIARRLAIGTQQKLLLYGFSRTKIVLKMILALLGLSLFFLLLLRPQWGEIKTEVEQEGRDLFIALDVSRSMLAQDVSPNRLAFCKQKIRDLIKHLKSERIGLVLFSGSAIVQCPLTTDYAAFNLFLDQIDAETISSGTTALDQAIKKVIDMFARVPGKKSKLLVVLTDGEDFSSNLAQIRQRAHQEGVHIFTLGVGTPEGAPVPVVDEEGRQRGHQKNEKGEVVISRLNEGILRTLAEESGGIYLKASPGNQDVAALVKQVELFEKEKFDDKKIGALEERYPLIAAAAFIIFLIEWIM